MAVTKKSSAVKSAPVKICNCKEEISALRTELALCKQANVQSSKRIANLENTETPSNDASEEIAHLRNQLRQLVGALKNRRGSVNYPQF